MEVNITQSNIEIEEMPQGCVLTQELRGEVGYVKIVVSYPDDAIAIIESLCKMIAIQYPEYLPNIACTGLAGTQAHNGDGSKPANQ